MLVELALLFVVFRYRRRPNDNATPPQTHGNAVLEVIWTLIPAFILLFLAVPTVRTIFETQAKVAAGALEIEVIGHQWWWEFKYPEYGIVTANEIYLPTGRTVNFKMTSADVIHSFWTPQLGGKRDVVTNRTNYIWYTPDSTLGSSVWNGFCVEYCGASHAKMRFRAFNVKPDEFMSWVAGQQKPAAFGAVDKLESQPRLALLLLRSRASRVREAPLRPFPGPPAPPFQARTAFRRRHRCPEPRLRGSPPDTRSPQISRDSSTRGPTRRFRRA